MNARVIYAAAGSVLSYYGQVSQLQSISFLHLRLSELKPSVYVMEKVAGFDRKKARLFF